MRLFVTVIFAVMSVTTAQQQHQQHQQVDPAYLRQYYAQLAQHSGADAPQTRAAPIHETQEQPQYLQQHQQQQGPLKNFPRPGQHQQQQQQQAYVPAPQHQPRQYQAQSQQSQYQQPQQAKAQPKPKRPSYEQEAEQESPEDYDPSPNYQFGFDVKDDEFTNYQNRKESREGNVIKGSYSVVDSDGFIRTVTYTADPKEGFKAEVVREPTDIVIKIPTQAPPTQQSQQQLYRQAPAPKQQQQHQQYQQQRAPQQQQQQARPQYDQYEQ